MTELRLLGPIIVRSDDQVNDVGASRPARLLVALFVAERHRLDIDALVDRCWDDDERPDDPVPAVRTTVRRLRRALGDDAVVTRPGGYELDLSKLDVDVDRFDELVAAGRAASDPVAAITSFRRALDLWRGRPFGEFADLDWVRPELIRLEESHLVAMEGWHEAHLRNGTATEIIGSLEVATLEHPLRERFHRQLMQALYVADRQADALRAFQAYRQAMAEAGLEPGAETVELERRIVAGDEALRSQTQGRPLRGYRIVERLGEGAFSIVYRGTQPSVDRDVAIKQIRAELANRPEFIRRFEAEARMVAHLEHPYIVPLYDYWREPGSAYLVMRLLPGGSLESSLLDGAWDVGRTQRMIEQIGAALAAAHRAGVVHRDVKPANILLDDEGNCFLTDFGIALAGAELVEPEASLSAGSPAYASPEQLRREPVGPSADVHGLAIAVYEALTGRLPFPDEPTQAALLRRQLNDPIPSVRASRTDVPTAVDDVLQRATTKLAAERYQTVEEFVTAFRDALGGTTVAPVRGVATMVSTEERNPYKGLRAFDEGDAGDFAGRERLVDQLVAGLSSNRLLAVVGPSGSGKSSVVRAGLLPALRRGAVRGSFDWYVATLLPGPHPDEELEASLLRIATERPAGLLDVIRDGDRGISRALRHVLPEHGELLLVIDQFEELFTQCDDESVRRRFLDGLAAAVTEERSRLRVVLTLRADFFDRPLRYESIGRLVRDATVPVLPLAADELERAIVEPAHSVGAEFEPGLVSEIAADVADQPGALPLLQYALTELYERRVSNLLTRDAYQAIGGVTGALSATAEELYESFDDRERVAARKLFGRLVTPGEGAQDTRRRVVRSEFGESHESDVVIDRFGAAWLFSFDRDPTTREPTVEVAHEALLREWPRLRSWLDDDREGLRVHRHLTDTSTAWIGSGRDPGELYRGGRLETAEVWVADHAADLNDVEREFLGASVAAHDAEVAAEREHVEQQARSNRRLRVLVGVATVVALVAAVAGVVALRERGRAEDNAAEASRNAATAEANAAAAERNATTAEQNAAEASRNATAAEQSASEAELARAEADFDRMVALARTADDPTVGLLLGLESSRLLGSRAVAFTSDREAQTLDALNRAMTLRPGVVATLGDRPVTGIGLVDDGARAVASTDVGVEVWNLDERRLEASWPVSGIAAETIRRLAVAEDGSFAVLGSQFSGAVAVDLGDGSTTELIGDEPVWGVAVHDRTSIALGLGDGSVRIVDDEGTLIGQVPAPTPVPRVDGSLPEAYAMSLLWAPSGGELAIGRNDGTVSIWRPGAAEPRWVSPISGPSADPFALGMVFSSDGSRLAVARALPEAQVTSEFYTGVEVLAVPDGSVVVPPIPDNFVRGTIAWADADETRLLAAALAGELSEFDLVTGERHVGIDDGARAGGGLAVAVGRDLLLAPGRLGIEVRRLGGGGPLVEDLAFTAEQLAAVAAGSLAIGVAFDDDSDDVAVAVVTSELAPITARFDGSTPGAAATDYRSANGNEPFVSGFGEFVATIDSRGITVRHGLDGDELGPPIPFPPVFYSMAVSPTGERLVTIRGGADGAIAELWDTATAEFVAVLEWPRTTRFVPPYPAVFDHVGSTVIVANFLANRLYDATTGEVTGTFEGDGLAVPWNGARIVADGSGDIRIVDADGERVGPDLIGHSRGVSSLVVSPDGRRLASLSADGTIRVWDLETGEQLGRPIPFQWVGSGAIWSPDSAVLAVTQERGVQLWNFDTDTWAEIACGVAGRNFTRAEWDELGPRGEAYRATCDQYPIEE